VISAPLSWPFPDRVSRDTRSVERYEIDVSGTAMPVDIVSAEIFGGEHTRRSRRYVAFVWAASVWAMVTNLAQALFRKLTTRRSEALRKILWDMGRDPDHVSCLFGDRFSRFNRQAKYCAAGWSALDLFYNYDQKVKPQLSDDLEGWMTRQWIEKCENRQAVTNRLKIVVNLLGEAFAKLSAHDEIRLLSIASGSAQAVIQAMQRFPETPITVLLLDADAGAIAEAKAQVEVAGLGDRFSYVLGTTSVLEQCASDFNPHIIEMVGFLDYRPRLKAISLIARIRALLPDGGVFITSNICHNREKIFLDWILLWPMIYRSDTEFADVLIHAGFVPDLVRILYEPFRIHGIAVCENRH
jgi:hypothetical protein